MDSFVVVAGLLALFHPALSHGRHVVDLTHSFKSETEQLSHWCSHNGSAVPRGNNSSRTRWPARRVFLGEYGGTHMIAPALGFRGGPGVDEVSLERLMGPAVVIDLSFTARLDPNTQLQIADVLAWEAWNGPIQENSILAVNTGWGRYWPNVTRILGTTNQNDPSTYRYPGIRPSTAVWLAKNRPQVVAVAIDTPTVDCGQNMTYSVYRTLAKANMSVFVNVARLDQLPPSGSKILAIPMKIKNETHAPLRIFAILHEHREKERDHFHLTTDLRKCQTGSASRGDRLVEHLKYLPFVMGILFFHKRLLI